MDIKIKQEEHPANENMIQNIVTELINYDIPHLVPTMNCPKNIGIDSDDCEVVVLTQESMYKHLVPSHSNGNKHILNNKHDKYT